MKNSVLSVLVIATILLSSCSNKFSIDKRRYNKGFHIAMSGSPKKTTTLKINETKNVSSTEKIEESEKTESQAVASDLNHAELETKTNLKSGLNEELSITRKAIQVKYQENNHQKTAELISANSVQINKPVKPFFKPLIFSEKEKKFNKKTENSDTKLILCVILAIFIPPLGMYIWKKDTDIWFILDLILFLFTFSWFFWGPFGTIGLAAIVIALLRVFDML
jgi:uncharacterized membrane protein YqaE (UPF0057 family)